MKIKSLCFFSLNIYRALLLRIEHCTTEKSKHRLPTLKTQTSISKYIYIHTYIYIYIYIYIVDSGNQSI